jgi:hypothetical protein
MFPVALQFFPLIVFFGLGQDFHSFFQQEIESVQAIRQLNLLQLPLGVFDPRLQTNFMLFDILSLKIIVNGQS